ncbi:undecaprenyldiphospho-muramoylpentapeptide beta-N-acetylglucosaminyltransferase [Acidocella sp.]|uniref:undecaprenyldiphospho-muramoylpentapeptide beta-N-acetylglucosaminyltransferase n=1 Tax=Acidocella sp. TaxID=50710 RepID=UPI0017D90FB6|nr:undecaprenyldiphospho-muramoylpentapeptide beta-N-acetylglucosaminyltransferase [Acidocella sp.]NNM55776.1 undecaprenyldiphospho-muramoylpentapeptide beta-N-acetylglucosaminyltransferase [Acidocella sp.]
MSAPVVIAAGGTGGHFFPAEALAAALLARGVRVVLLTDARSGGLSSAVFAKAERHVIAGAGLSGRSLRSALEGAAALARGVFQARKVLRALQPGVVVAFGGYPAVPPVVAAVLLGRRPRIFLHEQNAVLGRANRLLARLADVLVLSFEKTSAVPAGVKTVLLGNPVRPAVAALHGHGYAPPDGKIELLILGGSLGAKVFGSLMPQALALLPAALRARLVVSQQCRTEELGAARVALKEAGIEAELAPFFNDVATRLQRAHLVIARAGASSVAEIAVAGRPAIFIPLPSAIDDHQRANADALVDAQAAWRLDQAGLSAQALADKIESILMKPEDLMKAAQAAASAGRADAAERLAGLVMEGAGA